jgi:hypothetical protein
VANQTLLDLWQLGEIKERRGVDDEVCLESDPLERGGENELGCGMSGGAAVCLCVSVQGLETWLLRPESEPKGGLRTSGGCGEREPGRRQRA